MKVYIVTEGDYEDRAIVAVYDNKALANELLSTVSSPSNYAVQEWEVATKNRYVAQVIMPKDDKSFDAKVSIGLDVGMDEHDPHKFSFFHNDEFFMDVWTSNPGKALKVTKTARRKILVAGIWGDDEAAEKLLG